MDPCELAPMQYKQIQNQEAVYASPITCEPERDYSGWNKRLERNLNKNEFEVCSTVCITN